MFKKSPSNESSQCADNTVCPANARFMDIARYQIFDENYCRGEQYKKQNDRATRPGYAANLNQSPSHARWGEEVEKVNLEQAELRCELNIFKKFSKLFRESIC